MTDHNTMTIDQCRDEIAEKVLGWRDHAKRFYYQYGPVDSMNATDAGGALEGVGA